MKKHYIDNERFEEVISLYQQDPKNHEEELVNIFNLLIDNIIESFKFQVDADDAKQECFLLVLKTVPKFKSKKGTAFNYFTTIIVNNLKLLYVKNKKYREKIDQYLEKQKNKQS